MGGLRRGREDSGSSAPCERLAQHLARRVDPDDEGRDVGERHGRHAGAAREVERAIDRRVADDRLDARQRTRMMERATALVQRPDSRRRERVRDFRLRRRHAGPPSTFESACAIRRARRLRPSRRGTAGTSSARADRRRRSPCSASAPAAGPARHNRYRPMRRLYATRSMPRSAPSARSSGGASTQRSAGMRK